jgi:hypothetical protein
MLHLLRPRGVRSEYGANCHCGEASARGQRAAASITGSFAPDALEAQQLRAKKESAEWTSESTRRVASKLEPLVAQAAAKEKKNRERTEEAVCSRAHYDTAITDKSTITG